MGTLLQFPSRPTRPAWASSVQTSPDAVLVRAMAVVERYKTGNGTMSSDQLLDELLEILDCPEALIAYLRSKDEPLA